MLTVDLVCAAHLMHAGFVTEHVRITQFLSKAYRCLCAFEASHKRRQVNVTVLHLGTT
jgi:hypothetical protein